MSGLLLLALAIAALAVLGALAAAFGADSRAASSPDARAASLA
jgi:hypothetical protein